MLNMVFPNKSPRNVFIGRLQKPQLKQISMQTHRETKQNKKKNYKCLKNECKRPWLRKHRSILIVSV